MLFVEQVATLSVLKRNALFYLIIKLTFNLDYCLEKKILIKQNKYDNSNNKALSYNAKCIFCSVIKKILNVWAKKTCQHFLTIY